MAEVILMPRLSDTMTEGIIADWHKNVGDPVKKGDLLAEIETDKATMELESYKDGTLLHIGIAKGGKLQVNDLLAIIGTTGEDISKLIAEHSRSTEKPLSDSTEQPPGTVSIETETSEDGRLKASPLAKKLAAEKGIDLKNVQGTGDAGRITKLDIDNFDSGKIVSPSARVTAETTATPAPFVVKGEEGFADTANTQMRKTIARRLSESKFTAPHFYLTMEINMDNAIAARMQMNEVSPVKISFQDMLIKACAMALKLHPAVNSSWMDDFIRTYQHVHIGSAIALPEGLIVPVIRFADQKTLSQLAAESKELYDKARNKKLQPQEFSGNTFTISNLGMMDIDEFTAIVNPPDSCILAVGKIKEVVVKKADGFAVTNIMKVTLSCDHRSVDGAVGAAFLQTLKKFMENPVTMLV